MEETTATNLNVYDKISKGGYICTNYIVYTREEMRNMLEKSTLSPEDMKVVYNLNCKDAMDKIDNMITHFAEIDSDDKKISADEALRTRICTMKRDQSILRSSFAVQAGLLVGVLAATFFQTLPFSSFVWLSAVVLMSDIFAYISVKLFPRHRKAATDELEAIDGLCGCRMRGLLSKRRVLLRSIINTLHMYECLEDAIGPQDHDESSQD